MVVVALGCANGNEVDDVGLAVVLPNALARGAPNGDDCSVDFVFAPKLNPVLVLAPVVDVFVACPKVNPLTGFDSPSENAAPVEAGLFDPNEKGVLLLPLPLPKLANGEDCGT